MKLYLPVLAIVFTLTVFISPLSAQRLLQGTITDVDDAEPLIGATVLIKGTSIGAITVEFGNYSFVIPDGAATLVVCYIGYDTQ